MLIMYINEQKTNLLSRFILISLYTEPKAFKKYINDMLISTSNPHIKYKTFLINNSNTKH